MAKGIDVIPSVSSIKKYAPEQVLTAFNIPINESNKCLCPFHTETDPSMIVNEDYVYCFGCQESADTYKLAEHLLSKKAGRKVTKLEVQTFFKDNHLPEKTDRVYITSASYQGAVPDSLIAYWVSCMDDERYEILEKERLIVKETAQKYNIGWRPDWEAWTIPYYRGQLQNSLVDVVQYRLTNSSDKKYIGLKGHNRGTVMNAHLLEVSQRYLIVLFGAFDPILALQDNVIAVGLNGSNPFKKTEKERVQELFKKQSSIIVVPDNSPGEVKAAYTFAEWVGGQVRFFPQDLPDGCDYIDYRKLGFSALDFLQDVAGIEPVTDVYPDMMENILELLKVGDKEKFASIHAALSGRGLPAQDIARELAKRGPFYPFSYGEWGKVQYKLWGVKTDDDLFKTLDNVSQQAYILKSAW